MSTLLNTRPLLALAAAFVAGIVVWGGFNTAMDATNNNAFCISCHEMASNAFVDYEKTSHFRNPAGVRAGCSDCHVPRDWVHMTVRKIRATNELVHKVRGTIDTREKFLARRLKLAQVVWHDMKDTDSRECRNCHDLDFMDPVGQTEKARKAHEIALENRHTCIDCHKGVMHPLSEALREIEHEQFEKNGIACGVCHAGMAHTLEKQDWGW